MSKFKRAMIYTASIAVFLCICVGFALVNDELNIFGSLSVDVKNTTMLPESIEFISIVDENTKPDIERVIFDNLSSYADIFNKADGANIHTKESVEGSIKIFYLESAKTAYILADDTEKPVTIFANPDSMGIFKGMTSLKEVHFYNFDTSRVQSTKEMFSGCTSLEKIYVSANPQWTSLSDSENMFLNCTSLRGGYGTAVYTDGVALSLDGTYARIDSSEEKGYYTYSEEFTMPYFDSDVLTESGAEYNVKGSITTIKIANALDSSIYSKGDVKYVYEVYIEKEGTFTLHSRTIHLLAGGQSRTEEHTVSPVTDSGVMHTKIMVVATALSEGIVSKKLWATFNFNYKAFETAYEYKDGVIALTLSTNADNGNYKFEWLNGIVTDKSDPNLIFNSVDYAALTHTANLNSFAEYKFIFMVTDSELLGKLASAEITADSLITVNRE